MTGIFPSFVLRKKNIHVCVGHSIKQVFRSEVLEAIPTYGIGKNKNTTGLLKDEKGLLQCNIEEKAKLLQKCFFSREHLKAANFDKANNRQSGDTPALFLS